MMSEGNHATQQNSRLFEFPPEIRNGVYEAVLLEQEKVAMYEVIWTRQAGTSIETPSSVPPILQTCRQIRQEASGLYFARTTFNVRHRSKPLALPMAESVLTIAKWLRSLSAVDRTAIRSIQLDHGSFSYEHTLETIERYYKLFELAGLKMSPDVLYVRLRTNGVPTPWLNQVQLRELSEEGDDSDSQDEA